MTNTLLIISMVLISLFPSCFKKCSSVDETPFGYLPPMENYFGMYKPGNWWLYKNQDSTKTDSIFLEEFTEELGRDKFECTTFPTRTFKLHSQYLIKGTTTINGTYANNQSCCSNYFYLMCGAQMNSNFDTYPKSCYSNLPETFLNKFSFNSTTYNNVIFYETPLSTSNDTFKTFMAPNIGMLKYINGLDTFSLKTYHIQ